MKTLLSIVLLCLFPALSNAGITPQLHCVGTEPFWGIITDAKGFLSMSNPNSNSKKFYSKTSVTNAHGIAEGFAFQIKAQNWLKNTLKLNVVKTKCSDGMSDTVYPYTALVDVGGEIYYGCCK